MTLHHPSVCKLGKRAPKRDPRLLKLSNYLRPDLPKPPAAAHWSARAETLGLMGNDRYGDCTCAAVGHAIQMFTANTGAEVTISDADVLHLYTTVTGQEGAAFDPATGANDRGAMIEDALKEWRKNGVAGHQLGAYTGIDVTRLDDLRAAIAYLGVVDIGAALPLSAQSQMVWDVTDPALKGDAEPGSWGGHSIILTDYDDDGLICITWGQRKRMTWRWFSAYCDEAYALLSPDWVTGDSPAPSGFDLKQLQSDLAVLSGMYG